ncbi:regulator of sigma E protease [Andreprevotia lacus DSM 23236]|jgi:regulator of sigma E protease|uniref:Zinc metalloprotease n=1 Tax=Andreprevotia lacus DSM 23236 TaxID=1121001 RepID=A0A1W1XMK3_9NEIS|nr:RIP metalloprotease RseP [Andreprevotia lacus]SMC24758.1 regulator of sigma E protease [Andreprevotia lacus DSM 23236]
MHNLTTLLAFVVTLGILVSIHEYGHYWVARRCGIKVLVFSIGFGKPLLKWQRGDTQWQLAAIPLGGYVKMLDEREAPVPAGERQLAFNTQHPLKKMAVVLAGPLANLLLALVLLIGINVYGFDTIKPVVGQVAAGSLAAESGLRVGDEVVQVGGRRIDTWDGFFLQMLKQAYSESTPLTVRRPGQGEITLDLPLARLPARPLSPALMRVIGVAPAPTETRLTKVEEGSPAAKAGLRADDLLLRVNGEDASDGSALVRLAARGDGQPLQITVRRGAQQFTLPVTPVMMDKEGQRAPRIGVALSTGIDDARLRALRIQQRYGWLEAPYVATLQLWDEARITLSVFGHMLIGRESVKQVSGPLTIAQVAGESAEMGFQPFIQFLVVISLSLGIMNLLPVPVLDGGHLMYHTAELLTGRPVSATVEAIGQRIGLVFLLALMSLALFNDFHRFLFG